MKVTLAVDTEHILLASPDDYIAVGNLVTIVEKTREQVREWKAQGKTVDVLIEYSNDYIYRSSMEASNKTWSWFRPGWSEESE